MREGEKSGNDMVIFASEQLTWCW